ncbi:HTH-type transcriptional regulator Hpr [Pontibacillus yanchengensis]|uniref:Transcriptional regulator n=1 Tax=Pontibacillus yanchengensis Y32 TaxID=1385514 RepID=A0A0A2TBG7_9BACI|nr:HTH-type transcriptional regulator Hpr [Pontibacillus yanchengensis]KGP71396.1 transcriptional regulator [Pontibacillus yanchengensis Y32]
MHNHSLKEAILFSHRMTQLSKALWKSIEKDWRAWVKPHGLNINEHHILWILYEKDGTTISDLSNQGAMHVSTAFNFSRKLEERELLVFSKNDEDKRNTYITLTEDGKNLLMKTISSFNPDNHTILAGVRPFKQTFGKVPDFKEISSIIQNLYDIDYDETDSLDEELLEHLGTDMESDKSPEE